MECGLIIIGDEILSGYRQDTHLSNSIELLGVHGHRLSWCQIVGDEPQRIVSTLVAAKTENLPVFCFGGIGATPDDYTRQCAAQALGLPLESHPEAVALIEKQFGEGAYPERIRMAELPEQASLIPNPINQVPGFSVGDMHFLPGFPQMSKPMMAWVLENRYEDESNSDRMSIVLRVFEGHENEFIDPMKAVMALGNDVSISSLPVINKARNYVDFVIKGPQELVNQARKMVLERIEQQRAEYEEIEIP